MYLRLTSLQVGGSKRRGPKPKPRIKPFLSASQPTNSCSKNSNLRYRQRRNVKQSLLTTSPMSTRSRNKFKINSDNITNYEVHRTSRELKIINKNNNKAQNPHNKKKLGGSRFGYRRHCNIIRNNNKNDLIVYYQNVRSMKNKLTFLEHNLNMFLDKPDILILIETWLDSDISNSEINLKEYSIYRKDRNVPRCFGENCPGNVADYANVQGECVNECNCDTKRGGGVLVAVSNHLTSSAINSCC